MDDVAGTTAYEYDEVGRITAVNLSNGKKILYSYDEYGNISKLTYPDNTAVEYTYNALDQLTQIKDRQGKITKYDRDANGNITKVTRPNNTYSTIEYDDMGNVIKVVNMGKNPYYNISEELSSFAYVYDKSGFIIGEVAKTGKRIETSQYEYDERAQLVKVSQTVTENNKFVEETEMVYTYDGAGNRLSAVKTSGDKALCNIQYTYNDNNQITDIESDCDDNKQTHVVLTYDENGNLKNTTCNDTEKVRDYTYDNENRLKAVKDNGTLLMAALYDGNGDRIFRLDYRKNSDYVSNQAGTAENVYYSSNSSYDTDVILNEMLIPNGITNNTAINYELTGYINDINSEYTQVLTEFGANGNTTNVYEYGDGRNSATINGTKGYYLYDGRGSVAGLTSKNGGSMITYSYDAYGNTTKSNNTLNNPYQYNAEYTDSSTGLQYLRARYYDSSQGRFTAKDTLLGVVEDPITKNLYTYCGNNPLNYIDPSGHNWVKNTWNRLTGKKAKPVASSKGTKGVSAALIKKSTPKKQVDFKTALNYPSSFNQPLMGRYGYQIPSKGSRTGTITTYTNSIMQLALAERHREMCESYTHKAKDDGKKKSFDFNGFTAGLVSSAVSNIADPTGIFTNLINSTTGVDISGESYQYASESTFYAGKITGDVISIAVGAVETINGVTTAIGSIVGIAGGAAATSTGAGAAVGVPVVVVSVGELAAGVAEVGAGIAAISSGIKNISGDVQNYNDRINNEAVNNWNKGSFESKESSLEYHYNKHGSEVGATSPEQYARKAQEFAKNAKKGSTKSYVDGYVDGTIRYKKNGKYIDIAPDGTIVSFGKQ